jgi:DUF1680 family protein
MGVNHVAVGHRQGVRDHPAVAASVERGYLTLDCIWSAGEVVTLHLPMISRRTFTHPPVSAGAGRAGLERGPLVYCAEGPDNPSDQMQDLRLPPDAARSDVPRNGPHGPHVAVAAKALRLQCSAKMPLYTSHRHSTEATVLTANPYCLWANREPSSMLVWLTEAATGNAP